MGVTVQSVTSVGQTIANDGDVKALGNGSLSVTLASMGTSPALTEVTGSSGATRLRITSGSGSPAIAANNVQVTCGRAPRKVFLASSVAAPGFHVASISGSVINIGCKVAPAASTVYDLELVIGY